jgi:hypothetical protein
VHRRCATLVLSLPDIQQYHYPISTVPCQIERVDSLESRQLANTKGRNHDTQSTLDSRVPIGRVGSIKLVGVSHPLDVGILLDVIELNMSQRTSCVTLLDPKRVTHQFEVVISRNSLDVFDATLLEPLYEVSSKRDCFRH